MSNIVGLLLLLSLLVSVGCIVNVCDLPEFEEIRVFALFLEYEWDEYLDPANQTLMSRTAVAPQFCAAILERMRDDKEKESTVGILGDRPTGDPNDVIIPHLYYACFPEKCHPHPKIYLLSVYNQRYRNNVRFEQADFAVNESRQPIGRRAVRSPVRQYLDFEGHPCNAVKWFNNLTKVHLTPPWKDQYYCLLFLAVKSVNTVEVHQEKDLGFAFIFGFFAADYRYQDPENSICDFGMEKESDHGYFSDLMCACPGADCMEAMGQLSPLNFCPTVQLKVDDSGLYSDYSLEYSAVLKNYSDVCVFGISPLSPEDRAERPVLSVCDIPDVREYDTDLVTLQYYTRGEYSFHSKCQDCSYFGAAQHSDTLQLRPLVGSIFQSPDVGKQTDCDIYRPFNDYVYTGAGCERFYTLQDNVELFPVVGINVKPVASYGFNVSDDKNQFTYFYDVFVDKNNHFLDAISYAPEMDTNFLILTMNNDFEKYFGLCPVSVNSTTVLYSVDRRRKDCATQVKYSEDKKYQVQMGHYNVSDAQDIYGFKEDDYKLCGYNYNKSTTMCYCSQLMECDDPRTVMKAHFLMFGPATFRENSIYQVNTVDDVDVFLHRVAD